MRACVCARACAQKLVGNNAPTLTPVHIMRVYMCMRVRVCVCVRARACAEIGRKHWPNVSTCTFHAGVYVRVCARV